MQHNISVKDKFINILNKNMDITGYTIIINMYLDVAYFRGIFIIIVQPVFVCD